MIEWNLNQVVENPKNKELFGFNHRELNQRDNQKSIIAIHILQMIVGLKKYSIFPSKTLPNECEAYFFETFKEINKSGLLTFYIILLL